MKFRLFTGTRWHVGQTGLAAFMLAALWSSQVAAQISDSVVKIEEDWELVLSEPDPDNNAPQVTTCISPTANQNSLYAAFELNFGSQPSFVAGGMQLQLWNGEQLLFSKRHTETGKLSNPGEAVRWTQRMQLTGSLLTFAVVDGTSTTWSTFGQQAALSKTISTSLADLSGYNPSASVSGSGVGFASNRVSSLVLKKVRVYLSNGSMTEDATPRTVFPQ